jgi:membrane-associated HD superfamily phosphohydrolase
MKRTPTTSRNNKARTLAIIAGFLLIMAGVNGVATWETIKIFVTINIMDNSIVRMVFAVLIFIASLGGIAVIAGGLLLGKDKIRTGALFIFLGSGLGFIGLLFLVIVASIEKNLETSSFLSIGVVGLILSIIARMVVKRK